MSLRKVTLLIFCILFFGLEIKANAEIIIGDQINICVDPNMQAEQFAAFDSVNGRFLVVWDDRPYGRANIYGQLVNSDGSLYGGRITIRENIDNHYSYDPKVAFDSSSQRFLVVLGYNYIHQPEGIWVSETYGQFVNSDGSLNGGNFRISPDLMEIGISRLSPNDITFDTVQNRFLVVIGSSSATPYQLYGRFVNTDSSLGDFFQVTNFTSGYGVLGTELSYDSNNDRFLVVYGNGSDGDIYGRLLNGDGTPYSIEFIISDTGEPGGANVISSLSFDPSNNRFLAVFNRAWWLHNVQGQLINTDGSLYGNVITIFSYSDGGSSIFDPVNNKFLVVSGYSDTYGQLLNPDGSFFDSSFFIAPLPFSPILSGDSLSIGALVVWSVDLGYGSDREVVGRLIRLVNNSPELQPIGDKEIDEDQLLEFTISATDLEDDELSFSASNLPSGATFIDNHDNTATFSWLPTYEQSGVYRYVHFEVTDGVTIDEEDITITVNNVNRAPVLNHIGNKKASYQQGSLILPSDLLTFTVTGSDPDGDQLYITSPDLPQGATLIDHGDGSATFSWLPNKYQEGNHSVTFQISDGELSDEETINILVIEKRTTTELIEKYQGKIETSQNIKFLPSDKLRSK